MSSAAGKGAFLAIINLLVIAIAIAAMFGVAVAFVTVVMLGFVPAILSGALIGMFAGRLDDKPVMRFAILATLAVYGVGVIGAVFGGHQLVLPACVPTLAAVSLLERWTRRPPPEIVPSARIV